MDNDPAPFISVVYKEPCLWDPKDRYYQVLRRRNDAWENVARQAGMGAEAAKKKWRSLRDTYVRELKKSIQNYPNDDPDAEPFSKWPYFKLLNFLQGTIRIRGKSGKHSEFSWDDSYEGPSENSSDSEKEQNSKKTNTTNKRKNEEMENLNMEECNAKVRRWNDNNEREGSTNEGERSSFSREGNSSKYEVGDPEVQFLLSLVSFLKDVPDDRKLMVRSSILQVLIDERNGRPEKLITG